MDGAAQRRLGGALAEYWTLVGGSSVEVATRPRSFPLAKQWLVLAAAYVSQWGRAPPVALKQRRCGLDGNERGRQRIWGMAAAHGSLLVEVDSRRSTFSVDLGMGHYSGRHCDSMDMNVGGGTELGEMSS